MSWRTIKVSLGTNERPKQGEETEHEFVVLDQVEGRGGIPRGREAPSRPLRNRY